MTLFAPFYISSHLAPALRIGDATLTLLPSGFLLETSDQTLAHAFVVNPPRCRVKGATNESEMQAMFRAAVSFLSACAESQWTEANSDELQMLACELETHGLIAPS